MAMTTGTFMVSLSAQVHRPLTPLWKVVVNLVVNFATGSRRQKPALANSGLQGKFEAFQNPFANNDFADTNFADNDFNDLTMMLVSKDQKLNDHKYFVYNCATLNLVTFQTK